MVWAKGQTVDRVPVGYRKWFRRDGTRMRSGTFDAGEQPGEQVGEWTTCDKSGNVYKVTRMKGNSTCRAPLAVMTTAQNA